MRDRDQQRGSLLLQLIVVTLILGAGSFFVLAWRTSRGIVAREGEAMAVLRDFGRAQEEFRARTGGYGLLGELLDLDLREAELGPVRGALRDHLGGARLADNVLIHRGYCFQVLLADAGGRATRVDRPDLDRDFYIAYAWPEDFGTSGRRVFVIDDSAVLRAWENRLPGEQSYSGPDEAPPGHLAPPVPDRAQPFGMKRQGAQKSLIWITIGGAES